MKPIITGHRANFHKEILLRIKTLHDRRVETTLAQRDPWCTTYWNELKEKQAAYAGDALTTPALADGPYNTDDALAVLLAQHRYELAYGVLQNAACRPRKR